MLTNRNHFLWIEFWHPDHRRFRLPLSLLAFRSLIFSVTELILIATFLLPKATIKTSKRDIHLSIQQVRELLHLIEGLMLVLEEHQSFDLVDIETKDLALKLVLK